MSRQVYARTGHSFYRPQDWLIMACEDNVFRHAMGRLEPELGCVTLQGMSPGC